jgi:hypothetical protein
MTRSEGLADMLSHCTEAIIRHLDAAFARVWTLNEADNVLELQASAGMYTHINGPHARVPVGQFKIGLIAQERQPHFTNAVMTDPRVGDKEWARREGMVSFAGYPLTVGDRLSGLSPCLHVIPCPNLSCKHWRPSPPTSPLVSNACRPGKRYARVSYAFVSSRSIFMRSSIYSRSKATRCSISVQPMSKSGAFDAGVVSAVYRLYRSRAPR